MDALFKMLDNAADGAFIIDDEQRIIYWNQAAEEILGYSFNDVVGHSCFKILCGYDERGNLICHDHCAVSAQALAGQGVTNYDLATRTRSGEMRWINVSILTLADSANEESPLVVHLFRDATQTKQNEQFIHQMFDTVERWQQVSDPPTPPTPTDNLGDSLTKRELEVLGLLAQGLKTAGIAEALSISPSTVRNHAQNILYKLNVHSRIEAVAYAFEHGLVGEANN